MSQSSTGSLVRLDNVSVYRDKTLILDQIDLAIEDNEILTLIGPNGAGKTTLARLILGLLKPSSGQIWRRPHIGIGYVPQHLTRPPVLTLTVHGFLSLTYPCSKDRAHDLLTEVGVPSLIDQDIYCLSGGEFQRVLLARALLSRPQLLVLDEPLQHVDVTGQVDLYELLLGLHERYQCGIFLISHDLHVVMAKSDRVVCLNRHICCSGCPEEVSHHPLYTQLFGTHASHMLGIYSHNHQGHRHTLHGELLSYSPKS